MSICFMCENYTREKTCKKNRHNLKNFPFKSAKCFVEKDIKAELSLLEYQLMYVIQAEDGLGRILDPSREDFFDRLKDSAEFLDKEGFRPTMNKMLLEIDNKIEELIREQVEARLFFDRKAYHALWSEAIESELKPKQYNRVKDLVVKKFNQANVKIK